MQGCDWREVPGGIHEGVLFDVGTVRPTAAVKMLGGRNTEERPVKKSVVALATCVGIMLIGVMSFVPEVAPKAEAAPISVSNPVTSLPFDVVFASHSGMEILFAEEEYAVYMATMAHWWISRTQGFLGRLPSTTQPTAESLQSGSSTPGRMYVNSYGPFNWTAYADVWRVKSDNIPSWDNNYLTMDVIKAMGNAYNPDHRLLVVHLSNQYGPGGEAGVASLGSGFLGSGWIAVSLKEWRILAHEVGHSFGFHHLASTDCQGKSDGKMYGRAGSSENCSGQSSVLTAGETYYLQVMSASVGGYVVTATRIG